MLSNFFKLRIVCYKFNSLERLLFLNRLRDAVKKLLPEGSMEKALTKHENIKKK